MPFRDIFSFTLEINHFTLCQLGSDKSYCVLNLKIKSGDIVSERKCWSFTTFEGQKSCFDQSPKLHFYRLSKSYFACGDRILGVKILRQQVCTL